MDITSHGSEARPISGPAAPGPFRGPEGRMLHRTDRERRCFPVLRSRNRRATRWWRSSRASLEPM